MFSRTSIVRMKVPNGSTSAARSGLHCCEKVNLCLHCLLAYFSRPTERPMESNSPPKEDQLYDLSRWGQVSLAARCARRNALEVVGTDNLDNPDLGKSFRLGMRTPGLIVARGGALPKWCQ